MLTNAKYNKKFLFAFSLKLPEAYILRFFLLKLLCRLTKRALKRMISQRAKNG